MDAYYRTYRVTRQPNPESPLPSLYPVITLFSPHLPSRSTERIFSSLIVRVWSPAWRAVASWGAGEPASWRSPSSTCLRYVSCFPSPPTSSLNYFISLNTHHVHGQSPDTFLSVRRLVAAHSGIPSPPLVPPLPPFYHPNVSYSPYVSPTPSSCPLPSLPTHSHPTRLQIGRASCRERV